MATAVQPSTAASQSNPRVRLALASVVAALFVIAGIAAAVYGVPELWNRVIAPALPFGGVTAALLRLVLQAAAAVALVWVGSVVAGVNPPRGVRGGIFVAVSALVTVFFVSRAVGLNLEPMGGIALPVTAVVLAGLLYGTYLLLTSPQVQGYMVAIEDQGWFHTFAYKRTQGLRVRRATLIGFLLIAGSGVWELVRNGTLGTGPWLLPVPFTGEPPFRLPALTDVEVTVPLLLAAAAVWFAWRAINMPAFADFLIATEAEMNKVSWPTRRGLIQDTVVVLVTTVFLTLFLLVVDWFWGTLLSNSYVGVLPPQNAAAAGDNPGGPPKAPSW